MVARNLHTRDPIEGTRHPQALYLCLGWEVSFMPLHVRWHIAIRIFSMGITRERRLKPPGPNLPGEGGGNLPLSGPMERYLPLLAITHAR
jgi:hypothetical protein